MGGNTFGQLLKVTTFGESHGEALGVVIDGMPPRIKINGDDLQALLDRRAPGRIAGTSQRKESDHAEILSGIFESVTTGAPIAVIVRNSDVRSSDYEEWKNEFRPGHADRTTMQKYGIRDYRGGGRSSGRETISRVIAGYFAKLLLPVVSVNVNIVRLGKLNSPFSEKEQASYLTQLQSDGDSVGGKLLVKINHCPEGLGEPVFDKLKAELAKAMLSIGGCVSFSMGEGDLLSTLSGKEMASRPSVFSGIEGGISNGEPIAFELAFKAVSTVSEKAKSGRHDPCILPRVIPVVESMTYLVLADLYLRQSVNLLGGK